MTDEKETNWKARAEKAHASAQAFINQHFRNPGKRRPLTRIPANRETDDDLILSDYIKESANEIDRLRAELEAKDVALNKLRVAARSALRFGLASQTGDRLRAALGKESDDGV